MKGTDKHLGVENNMASSNKTIRKSLKRSLIGVALGLFLCVSCLCTINGHQALAEWYEDMPIVEDVRLSYYERSLFPAFEELYARNNDIVGWIITGGSVDYPILYRDNNYYMNHDFDGMKSDTGAIFLDERDNVDMNNDCLLFYGHNMKSGLMFGGLDEYRNIEVLRENPIIYIHNAREMEERKYVYFAIFDASMNFNDSSFFKITNFDFETNEEKQKYLDEIISRSIYSIPVDVGADDQIVVLVTCSYNNDNGRFLLFGRQLREDETVDDMIKAVKKSI